MLSTVVITHTVCMCHWIWQKSFELWLIVSTYSTTNGLPARTNYSDCFQYKQSSCNCLNKTWNDVFTRLKKTKTIIAIYVMQRFCWTSLFISLTVLGCSVQTIPLSQSCAKIRNKQIIWAFWCLFRLFQRTMHISNWRAEFYISQMI